MAMALRYQIKLDTVSCAKQDAKSEIDVSGHYGNLKGLCHGFFVNGRGLFSLCELRLYSPLSFKDNVKLPTANFRIVWTKI